MTCSDFLDRYSDFRDDDLLAEESERFQGHLSVCASCRRYDRTVSVGASLFREAPLLSPREDFKERLRFSIYQEEREARRRGNSLLGRGMMVGVGAAATIAAVMAMALLREAQPIAESAPMAAGAPAGTEGSLSASLFDPIRSRPLSLEDQDFLTGSNVLLYESSPLFRRHREPEILMTELR
jgi:hypothetical protein